MSLWCNVKVKVLAADPNDLNNLFAFKIEDNGDFNGNIGVVFSFDRNRYMPANLKSLYLKYPNFIFVLVCSTDLDYSEDLPPRIYIHRGLNYKQYNLEPSEPNWFKYVSFADCLKILSQDDPNGVKEATRTFQIKEDGILP